MHLFFIQKIESDMAWLGDEEAHHCVKVLRRQVGDFIEGIDGKGNFFRGNISKIEKDFVAFHIVGTVPDWGESGGKISLAISVLHKPDRLEWLVEKAVELGVTELIPFLCKRTVKQNLKVERLDKIMISALKQCKRSRLPLLDDQPATFEDLLNRGNPSGLRFILWCDAGQHLNAFNDQIAASDDLQFLIGPEGDFLAEEVEKAQLAGFIPVSLGHTRLRAETAALHVLSVAKHLRVGK